MKSQTKLNFVFVEPLFYINTRTTEQHTKYFNMTLQLESPFTLIVSGPSSSGKTSWTCHFLNNLNDMVDKTVDQIIWCYAEENSTHSVKKCINEEQLSRIKFVPGIPNEIDNPDNQSILYVIDDLMMESYNKQVCALFTRGSHHLNLSIILITQNIFHSGKYCRDISLNAKYMCIFKSPRDGNQFRYLAKQIYPEASSSLYNVYKTITDDRAFSYLFIDLTQKTNHLLRFRTNIFNKNHTVIYCSPQLGHNVYNETFREEPVYVVCFENSKPTIT